MLVDCQTCPVRDVHCADCMVTALATIPFRAVEPVPAPDSLGEGRGGRPRAPRERHRDDQDVTASLDRAERRAVSAFLSAGLVTVATANAARARIDPVAAASDRGRRRAV